MKKYYKCFYTGACYDDIEAKEFQKQTGWHMIWASDSQGMNGDTYIVFRHYSDLPIWLQDYAKRQIKANRTLVRKKRRENNGY